MTISAFISSQPAERQKLLKEIHEIIIREDKNVKAEIGLMMKNEMIIYNAPGTFKYGLASVKQHMSLHLLPMYSSPEVYAKYKELLPDAGFQKGCINFKSAEEMPLKIIKQLMHDCSKID
ncbi:MAG TPA: DUF1801 domain-containing protein, partial [Puia sp.]|nr:DUF1801 domain-containing protein [Puia sp.]